MYDSLNVLSSMEIIRKDKYNIMYNHFNDFIPQGWGEDTDNEEEVEKGYSDYTVSGEDPSTQSVQNLSNLFMDDASFAKESCKHYKELYEKQE